MTEYVEEIFVVRSFLLTRDDLIWDLKCLKGEYDDYSDEELASMDLLYEQNDLLNRYKKRVAYRLLHYRPKLSDLLSSIISQNGISKSQYLLSELGLEIEPQRDENNPIFDSKYKTILQFIEDLDRDSKELIKEYCTLTDKEL